VARSFVDRVRELHAEAELKREAWRKGVDYRTLKAERAEEERLRQAIQAHAERWQAQVVPFFVQAVSDRMLHRLPELLNRFGDRLIAQAAEEISRRVLAELPAGVHVLPAPEAQKAVEDAVRRIPIEDVEAILDHLSRENAQLME